METSMINIPIYVDQENYQRSQLQKKTDVRDRCLDNYREVTRDEFVEILNSSQSFIPSKTKNKGNDKESFVETRVIILDVDNTVKDEKGKVVDLSKDDSRYLSIERFYLSIQFIILRLRYKSIRYSENLENTRLSFY